MTLNIRYKTVGRTRLSFYKNKFLDDPSYPIRNGERVYFYDSKCKRFVWIHILDMEVIDRGDIK